MYYDHKCDNCEFEWEEEYSINADPPTQCPKCKEHTAKRLITGGNFILLGSGWASEGYSSK